MDNSPLTGKYGDVLTPFVMAMEAELHANAGKGDRPGWLKMSPAIAMLEIYYHVSKLQKAVKDDNGPGIQEYAADVANMAMMLLDICGGLDLIAVTAKQSKCQTCKGRGEIGGHVGQTPEQFDYVTERCPDCGKAGRAEGEEG